ncbi:MAG: chaperone NapD [Granulosicoccaceae bacterium]
MHGVIPILAETPSKQDVHIASLVVQLRPESRGSIERQIKSMPHCTCYSDKAGVEDERDSVLVVVMEVSQQGDINRVIADLNQLVDVLNVNLVYHYCDSAQSMTDELEVAQ